MIVNTMKRNSTDWYIDLIYFGSSGGLTLERKSHLVSLKNISSDSLQLNWSASFMYQSAPM